MGCRLPRLTRPSNTFHGYKSQVLGRGWRFQGQIYVFLPGFLGERVGSKKLERFTPSIMLSFERVIGFTLELRARVKIGKWGL